MPIVNIPGIKKIIGDQKSENTTLIVEYDNRKEVLRFRDGRNIAGLVFKNENLDLDNFIILSDDDFIKLMNEDSDFFIHDTFAAASKDDINYLCEKYLNYDDYKNEPFEIIFEKLKSAMSMEEMQYAAVNMISSAILDKIDPNLIQSENNVLDLSAVDEIAAKSGKVFRSE